MMIRILLEPSSEGNSTSSHDHVMMSSCCHSVAFLGPSITPYQHNNPAYRIYEMDGLHNDTTFQLIDHHVYFLNLTIANSDNNVTWQYLYGAKVK